MSVPTDYILDELNSIAECCICFDRYKDPRTLPCIHTFCLQCIQHTTQQKLPGDRVRCPLCNQTFIIPADGIASLPGNPFVSRILELGNSAIVPGSDRQLDQESCERRKLKRNADIVSRLLTDGIRCTQVREKVVTNVLAKHEIVKDAIIKKIETLNLLLDDLLTQKQRKMGELEDEMDEMDSHLTTLASYKNYCLELAEKGAASDVTRELVVMDKRLQELEEEHEARIGCELGIHQKLLDDMLLGSVLSSGLLDNTAGNVQDLLRRNNSSEPQNGGTEEPNKKRMRVEGSNMGGGGLSGFTFGNQSIGNFGSSNTGGDGVSGFTFGNQSIDNFGSSNTGGGGVSGSTFGNQSIGNFGSFQPASQILGGYNTNGSSSSAPQHAAYSGTSPFSSATSGPAVTAPGVSAPPGTASDPSAATLGSGTTFDFSTAFGSSTAIDPRTTFDFITAFDPSTVFDFSTGFESSTSSDPWTISDDVDL